MGNALNMTDIERVFIHAKQKQTSTSNKIQVRYFCSHCRTVLNIKFYAKVPTSSPCIICGKPTKEGGWYTVATDKETQ